MERPHEEGMLFGLGALGVFCGVGGIMLKMEDAYENSDTPPPQRWEQVFKNMSREDFMTEWRKLE